MKVKILTVHLAMAGSYTVKKKNTKKLLPTYRYLDKIINFKKKEISSKGKKNI